MAPKKQPTAFPLFSALPAELRLAIWKFACHPRVVEVWYDSEADRCRTTARPPAVLQANRESRQEAMSMYRRAFVTRSQARNNYIYFSPALDVLYLPRHGLMGYDDTARDFTVHVRDTAEYVWSLAIDHVRSDTIRPWEPYNKLMLIFSFPNVKETILVVNNSNNASPNNNSNTANNTVLSARRRSHDSVASAQSIASTASTTSTTSTASSAMSKTLDVELVDPKGDDNAAVMGLIDNVIESFSREILDAGPTPKVDCDNRVHPSMPSLIPKAKAYHRRRRTKRRLSIGCV